MDYPRHDHFIVVFATTRGYIVAREKVKNIPHEERNTPRELYDQCGMCLFFSEEVRADVEKILPPSDPRLVYLPSTR